ncbi:MAG: ABC transporter permease [Deltaproteobacteria bacterium]|nr:ABC transporter permease [Deltaproteobacteria bacterium]
MRALSRWARWSLAFYRRDLLTELSYRTNFFFGLAGGLFSILTFYFLSFVVESGAPGLSRFRGGYFAFVLLGLAASALLREALGGFAARVRQAQLTGTLEVVLATPISPAAVILCASIYPLWSASLRAGLYLVFGWALFSAELSLAHWPAALAALALGVTSFAAIGILSASATMILKRGDPVAWSVGALSLLLGGVYYPVEILPEPLRSLADWLPITHTLTALREALLGQAGPALPRALLLLALFCVVLLPVALVAFTLAVRRARREGSLTHF